MSRKYQNKNLEGEGDEGFFVKNERKKDYRGGEHSENWGEEEKKWEVKKERASVYVVYLDIQGMEEKEENYADIKKRMERKCKFKMEHGFSGQKCKNNRKLEL